MEIVLTWRKKLRGGGTVPRANAGGGKAIVTARVPEKVGLSRFNETPKKKRETERILRQGLISTASLPARILTAQTQRKRAR